MKRKLLSLFFSMSALLITESTAMMQTNLDLSSYYTKALFATSTAFGINFICRKTSNKLIANTCAIGALSYYNHKNLKKQPKSFWIDYGIGMMGGILIRKTVDLSYDLVKWLTTGL